jgi:hypothetical protein
MEQLFTRTAQLHAHPHGFVPRLNGRCAGANQAAETVYFHLEGDSLLQIVCTSLQQMGGQAWVG